TLDGERRGATAFQPLDLPLDHRNGGYLGCGSLDPELDPVFDRHRVYRAGATGPDETNPYDAVLVVEVDELDVAAIDVEGRSDRFEGILDPVQDTELGLDMRWRLHRSQCIGSTLAGQAGGVAERVGTFGFTPNGPGVCQESWRWYAERTKITVPLGTKEAE